MARGLQFQGCEEASRRAWRFSFANSLPGSSCSARFKCAMAFCVSAPASSGFSFTKLPAIAQRDAAQAQLETMIDELQLEASF
jgi:hypothetical protein